MVLGQNLLLEKVNIWLEGGLPVDTDDSLNCGEFMSESLPHTIDARKVLSLSCQQLQSKS